MTRPVQVTFRQFGPSAVLEQDVRARAAELDTYYAGLIGCHVLLEIPHQHHEHGNAVHVRIELSVPGENIVVSHEPSRYAELERAGATSAHKQDDVEGQDRRAMVAIRDAFALARRRLEDFARRQRGDVKTHRATS